MRELESYPASHERHKPGRVSSVLTITKQEVHLGSAYPAHRSAQFWWLVPSQGRPATMQLARRWVLSSALPIPQPDDGPVAAVPEPTSLALLTSGLLIPFVLRLQNRKESIPQEACVGGNLDTPTRASQRAVSSS